MQTVIDELDESLDDFEEEIDEPSKSLITKACRNFAAKQSR